MGWQVLEWQIKATCKNERVKPFIIHRDGRSRKLKLMVFSFIFPCETVHQLRVRWIRADMEVISQLREPQTTDSNSPTCLGTRGRARGRSRSGKVLGAESEQGLASVFRFSPSSSPTWRPQQRHLRKRAAWISRFAVGNENEKVGVRGDKDVGSDAW